jgi:predicted O-linked N-acetylglucosamine transferase (SPINDLY family)
MGAVLHLCDWDGADARATASRANKVIVPPLTMLACSDDPALHLECARRYLRHSLPVLPEPLPRAAARKGERIRIAYLSADFREHATAFLIAELLECHDRSRFEVVGISTGQNDTSEVRARIMAACDQFHDIEAADDRRAAKLVRQLEADILVDLNGHTHGFRPGILAQRPAPVQVSYLGYPGTLGAEFMDYIIADPVVLPRSQQPFYAERIVHLPGCYQVNDTKRRASQAMPSRAECGLPEEGFVFCCFNNSGKITAPIFAVWMRLLDRTPGSVLWLFGSNNEVRANLCRQATVYGIDTARLIFAGQKPSADHLARYHLVDLFLDTLPYNAHTTASDALRMGVPLVTCMGRSFASRVAASLLAAAGLPDLVARNLNDYETMAFEIAHQPSLLGSLRRRLEDPAANTLFDLDRFRRGIESAYTRMHAIAYEGIAPYGFVVAAED